MTILSAIQNATACSVLPYSSPPLSVYSTILWCLAMEWGKDLQQPLRPTLILHYPQSSMAMSLRIIMPTSRQTSYSAQQ
ncbi:hypothetical protein TNCV_946071 [Trichonephila clavipes]|nr:hypothetical protein TNCV_946071 [Trichonephila clavipes]